MGRETETDDYRFTVTVEDGYCERFAMRKFDEVEIVFECETGNALSAISWLLRRHNLVTSTEVQKNLLKLDTDPTVVKGVPVAIVFTDVNEGEVMKMNVGIFQKPPRETAILMDELKELRRRHGQPYQI